MLFYDAISEFQSCFPVAIGRQEAIFVSIALQCTQVRRVNIQQGTLAYCSNTYKLWAPVFKILHSF